MIVIWFAWRWLFLIGVIVVLVIYGFVVSLGGRQIFVTTSIVVAVFPDDGTEPGEAPGNAPDDARDDARGGATVAQRAAGAATKPGEATAPAQPPRPVPHSGRNDPFDRLLAGIARIVIGRPRAVIAVFAGLTVAAAVGMTRVEVESATVQMLSTDVPIRRADDFICERMGSSMSPWLVE